MKFSITICFLALILFLVSGVTAQTQAAVELQWTRLKDDVADISALFPADYLVDNEAKSYSSLASSAPNSQSVDVSTTDKLRIYGSRKGIRLKLTVKEFPRGVEAKKYLFYLVDQNEPKDNYQDFQISEFTGREISQEKDKTLLFNLIVAAKNKVFFIDASATKENESIYLKFIHSVLLNGKPLLKNTGSEPSENFPAVLISSLKTSQEISDALKQKTDTSESQVIKDPPSENEETALGIYSRPLLVLTVPQPEGNQQNGKVILKVFFLASGKIGGIYVVPSSPKGLISNAVKAAKKIKFLPAEMDGKKVDSVKQVQYSFSFG